MAVPHHGDGTYSLFRKPLISTTIVPRHAFKAELSLPCVRHTVPRGVSPPLQQAAAALSPHPFSMPPARPYQCLTLSFLLITSLIILSYFFAQFPLAPQGYCVYPSLSSLGPETKAKDIYPAEYYPGGAYVSLPFGNVGVHFTISPLSRFPNSPHSPNSVLGPLLVIRP
jgi:hypothetical protein